MEKQNKTKKQSTGHKKKTGNEVSVLPRFTPTQSARDNNLAVVFLRQRSLLAAATTTIIIVVMPVS